MTQRPKVALFVTCLADFFRPQVGFAAAKLLEQAGCDVAVPVQSCCGQPAYNGGDAKDAAAIAKTVIGIFAPFDFVVAPSASCAGMIRNHYPLIFAKDEAWGPRARALAEKTHELFSFLVNLRGMKSVDAEFAGEAVYQDSCSSLREMKVTAEPRALLGTVHGLTLKELHDKETCCGFGGLFALKYPEISARLADDKIADAAAQGAKIIVGGDLGCLLHLAGRLAREGKPVRVRHAAEICAGINTPAVGEGP
ncbi:MAG: (Fe-S)-binding protein [Alphaproteobacteria bacterium]